MSERKQAEEKLQETLDKLETRVADRTKALRESEQSLRGLSTRLLQLQDEERRRIARELHDSTGQKLTALAMNLALSGEDAAALSARGRRALEECTTLADQTVREIRTLSYLLHPPLLEELGLAAALRWYVEGFSERSGIHVALDVPEQCQRAPEEVELALFRVVQEALTNLHRYSGSSDARIRLASNAAALELEVQDFGQGLPPEMLQPDGIQQLGVGLRGMQERITQLGGKLEIESSAEGTTIRVRLPLRKKELKSKAAGGKA
jgi:signal transduction histidine kinase